VCITNYLESLYVSRLTFKRFIEIGYTGGEEFLVSIAWEDDHVQSVLKKVKQVVNSNKKVPERFIRDTYAKYEPLLQQPFSELYGETDEMIWDKNEKVRDEIFNTCFTLTNIQCSLSDLLVVQEAYGRIE
jgi:hypothetical protein